MHPEPHAADLRLINFLVARGLLGEEATRATHSMLAARNDSRSAVEILVDDGLLAEDAIAHSLADGLRIPFVDLATHPLEPEVTGLLKEGVVTRYKLIALRRQGKTLVVAAVNPLDREGLRAVELATGRTVRPEVTTLTAFRDAVQHAYHLEDALNAYLGGVSAGGDAPFTELGEESTDLSTLIRGTQPPPVVKLLDLILVDAIRSGASDIHIESSPVEVRVRYRVEGVLQESFHLPKWVQDPLTARCKVLGNLDITERRVPQDARIRIRCQEKMVDLRVSSLPTQFGEKVTMRILDPRAGPDAGVTTVEEVIPVVDAIEADTLCPTCAHVVEETFSVCPNCGIVLRSQCQRCGKRLHTDWNACPHCGGAPSVRAAPKSPPAAPPSAAPPAVPAAGDGDTEQDRRFRILIVDDERDFRYLLKVFLQHSDLPVDVVTAGDGRQAIDAAAVDPPDLVLLDVMMPEMDGFEVCRQLRANVRTAFVPILMLTALDDSESRTQGFLAGTDDYIAKPFDRQELLARVKRILRRTYGLDAAAGPESPPHLQAPPSSPLPPAEPH